MPTNINIDDLSGRGIDLLIHSTLYNEYPTQKEIRPNKKVYVITRVRQEYISYPNRAKDMGDDEATLPYYSTNIRDALQLCNKFSYDYDLSYTAKSGLHLATINKVNFIHQTAAGAISRALLAVSLKKKFNSDVVVVYRLLDNIVEI